MRFIPSLPCKCSIPFGPRDIEQEIIPLCRELGIGLVAYSPLGVGFFARKTVVETFPEDSLSHVCHPRFSAENVQKNKVFYTRVANLATKHRCTPPQLALAWLLHQGINIITVPGTTKVKNLTNNLGSLALKLTEEDVKEISDAFPIDEVSGSEIYPIVAKYAWSLKTPHLSKNLLGLPSMHLHLFQLFLKEQFAYLSFKQDNGTRLYGLRPLMCALLV
ncbi:unnamed protein product [Linum trigynum]|uniref:NADP-dependent oxidoreductase domain-containing protein n=1 Tax=Linum trigynum TaxID=586398 RepID=A0AAV2GLU4_9ROSI